MQKHKLLPIVICFISVVFALLLFELFFGNWFTKSSWLQTDLINVRRNVDVFYDVSHLGYQLEPSHYVRDEYGLRGSCKANNLAQIITVGGSTTDQQFISEGKTWQDRLQNLVSQNLVNRPYCIANAGVNGHSTFGHLKSFDYWYPLIKNFKPNFFLFYIGINDASLRFDEFDWYDNNPLFKLSLFDSFKEKSVLYHLYDTIQRRLSQKAPQFAGHRERVIKTKSLYTKTSFTPNIEFLVAKNTAGFSKRLNQLLERVASHGALPICVSQPHATSWKFGGKAFGVENAFVHRDKIYNGLDYDLSLRALNKEMEKICLTRGGYFIDLYNKPFELTDFYDYVHMTPKGVEKVATYLFEEIKARNIISKKN